MHRGDVLRPLGMGLSCSAGFVDWYARGALDILLCVHPWYASGGVYLYVQDLSVSQDPPVYFPAQRLADLSGHFLTPVATQDGKFDLLGYVPRNPGPRSAQKNRTIGWLQRFRNVGTAGAPLFYSNPDPVPCAGQSLEAACGHKLLVSLSAEYTATGALCGLLAALKTDPMAYWPDRIPSWHPEATEGRDAQGNWRGEPASMQVLRFPVNSGDPQAWQIGKPRKTAERNSLFSIDAAKWTDHAGRRWTALRHDTDRLTISPGPNSPLDETISLQLRDHFFNTHISTTGLFPEKPSALLLTGNTGFVSRLAPLSQTPREHLLMQRGGPLRVGTLAVPSAIWHEDNARIYVGDATGHVTLFEGSSETGFGPGHKVQTPTGPIVHMAGETGSIQGPNEARWGYTNPLVTPWTHAEHPDLIVTDITGAVMLYPFDGDTTGRRFGASRPLWLDNAPLRSTWRSRPARWSQDELLVHMPEGLVLLERDPAKAFGLRHGRPVRFADGRPVAARGVSGLSGRSVLQAFAVPNEAKQCLVVGTDHRTFGDFRAPDASLSGVIVLEAQDTPEALILAPGRILRCRTGAALLNGLHNPGPTILPPRQEQPGRLILGTEDGHLDSFDLDQLQL